MESKLDKAAKELGAGQFNLDPEPCPNSGHPCAYGNICHGGRCLINDFNEDSSRDLTQEEIDRAEAHIERSRGGKNLAYDNNRELAK